MEILKKSVLLFLFLYLAEALKIKKQNQTTSTVNPKIDKFIEDEMEIKLNLNNHNNDEDLREQLLESIILKENSTVKNLDLTKKLNKSVTPRNSVDKSASQAIYLPIDLLLKHPKLNGTNNTNSNSKSRRNLTNTNNPIVNYLKPKIDFCEDTMEAVDESIADFYSAIKTNNRTNETFVKLDDFKVVDDYVNIKMSSPESTEVTNIDARNSLPNTSTDQMNSSVNVETQRNLIKTPTTTIEIVIKCEPSTPNEALRSRSSIVIHNTTYQEITQPAFCPIPYTYSYIPRWPYRSWYGTYPYNFYKYPYTKHNGQCYFYNNQNSMPYSAPNIVRKTWNNMDLSMTNPNYMTFNSEETKDSTMPEYDDNMYEIYDQNVI